MGMQGIKSRGTRVSRMKYASLSQDSVCHMFANIPLGKACHGLTQSPEMGQNTLPIMEELKNSTHQCNQTITDKLQICWLRKDGLSLLNRRDLPGKKESFKCMCLWGYYISKGRTRLGYNCEFRDNAIMLTMTPNHCLK